MRLPRGIRRVLSPGGVRTGAGDGVEEELRYHVERRVEELVAQGMERSEAEAAARHRFGDMDAYRRALHRIDEGRGRDMKRTEVVDMLTRGLGRSLRSLARTPGFTFAIVTILALGLGANAVVFGVVDRLLLSPPPHVQDPDQVRTLYAQRRMDNGESFVGRTFTYADYADLVGLPALAGVAAWSGPSDETLGRGEAAHPVAVASATASFFPVLGVQPVLGRPYDAGEAEVGGAGAAVISSEMWEREFASDPGVLGRSLDLSTGGYTVVGVMPPGFTGVDLEPVDVWVPLELHEERETGTTIWREHRNWWWIHIVARLADGTPEATAVTEATTAHRRARRDMIDAGDYDREATLVAASLIAAQGPDPSSESRVARWLAAVSVIVLLIACFNVANLLLARGAYRQREVAVRLALGVSRSRLLGELLAQSLILSLLGAAGALAVARVVGPAVQHVLLPDVAVGASSSPRLLAFLTLAAVVSGLLAGAVPAVHATRSELAGALKGDGGGGRSSSRSRTALLLAQAALSVVLLVGAGLFVKSLRQARDLDLGFDPRHVVVAQIQWNESLPAQERTEVYRSALERVRRIPGARAAGLTYSVPFQSSMSIGQPRIPGLDSVPRHPNGGPYVNKVSSGYFEAMGLRVLQGRSFQTTDDTDRAPPVAVVSQSMARAYWPAGDAVGSCMFFGKDDENPPCTEVVGVVEDHRREELVEAEPEWLYYVNQAQPAFRGPPQGLMVGTERDATDLVGTVQAEMRATSGEVRFVSAQSLQRNIDPHLRSWTLGASMFSAFGLLALVVAAWGLYSVLAFEVATRRRELGIRVALGAGMSRVLRLVLLRAVAVGAVGVGVGLVAAAAAARLVGPLLFTVSPWDPSVYAGVTVTLLAVSAGAGLLPAWRATRTDPKEALQAE